MIRNRAVIGLSLLCALAFCAFAASSASAADGTTQFTCVAGQTDDFSDADCNVGLAGGGKGHLAVANGTKTPIDSVQTENAVLTSTNAGIKTIITCTKVAGTGTQTNSEPSKGTHTVSGEKINIVYSGCSATIAGGPCPVVGGVIEVKNASSHDVENPHTFKMGILFSPPEKQPFTIIGLGPCAGTGGVVQEFPVEGSALGLPEGAKLKFNKASTEPTLTFGKQKASLVSTVTVTNEESKTPLTVTTTDKVRTN